MKKIQLLGSIAFGLIALIPSTASAATFTHNLSYGVTTTDVSQLQQFLADEGLYSGTITATFGSLTRSAVIAFQKQEGIVPANGYFGSVTRADANRVIAAHPEWTTTLGAYTAYLGFKTDHTGLGWLMVAIAVLFNPIAPIYFAKGTWSVLDLIVAIIFFGSASYLKNHHA